MMQYSDCIILNFSRSHDGQSWLIMKNWIFSTLKRTYSYKMTSDPFDVHINITKLRIEEPHILHHSPLLYLLPFQKKVITSRSKNFKRDLEIWPWPYFQSQRLRISNQKTPGLYHFWFLSFTHVRLASNIYVEITLVRCPRILSTQCNIVAPFVKEHCPKGLVSIFLFVSSGDRLRGFFY